MATDYGGAYGEQPRRDAQPPYGGPDEGGPTFGGPPHGWQERGEEPRGGREQGHRRPGHRLPPRNRRAVLLSVTVVVLGSLGFVGFGSNALIQFMPRKFTAQQRQQITDWEYGKRWRDLTAGEVFPASISYAAPAVLTGESSLRLSATRAGVAKQAGCAAATDPAVAKVLDHEGCEAVLRATYLDETDSFVVTVGVAVLPTSAGARSAAQAIGGIGGVSSTVQALSVKGSPAAAFTDKRRQLSGVAWKGTYVVLYTVGYADSRPKEPVASDGYTDAEMTTVGGGVAHGVLSVLAAPVPVPACPGTPGC